MMETTTRRDATRCGKFTMGRGKGGVLDARRGQVCANGIVTGLAGPAWEVWVCLDTHKDSDRLLHGSHGWEAPRSQTTQHTSRCLWQTTYLGRKRIAENGNMVHVPPVSPRPAPDLRTHPQPQTSRYRPDTVSRESDVTLPGWGGEPWMETGDTVHSRRQPPGRVSAVTSDHIVMM